MSYPETLGELWDLGPEVVEALEAAELWEREATIADEQAQRMRDTLQELQSLTNHSHYQSERSPNEVRNMVQEVLDACQADF